MNVLTISQRVLSVPSNPEADGEDHGMKWLKSTALPTRHSASHSLARNAS